MDVTLKPRVDAEAARAIADEFLIMEVGDLLGAEEPQLVEDGRPRWVLTVILGNAVRGLLGKVGCIAVDAETGDVIFDEAERTRILANARRLSRPSAP